MSDWSSLKVKKMSVDWKSNEKSKFLENLNSRKVKNRKNREFFGNLEIGKLKILENLKINLVESTMWIVVVKRSVLKVVGGSARIVRGQLTSAARPKMSTKYTNALKGSSQWTSEYTQGSI